MKAWEIHPALRKLEFAERVLRLREVSHLGFEVDPYADFLLL